MSKDRDDQLNHDAEGEFRLEDIIREFGSRAKQRPGRDDAIPFPVSSRPQGTFASRKGGRVVNFPGGTPPEETPPTETEEQSVPPEEGTPGASAEQPMDNVVAFPGEEEPENPIAEGLSRLSRKADEYAAHMFEDEGSERDEAVLRAERYIPGTDEEAPAPPERERRRRQPPPAPDLPPAELARRWRKGLKGLRLRMTLAFLLCLPMLYLTLAGALGLPLPEALDLRLQVLALAGLLVLIMLLGVDVLAQGLFRLFRLEFGTDTLLVFSCAATLADALCISAPDRRGGQLPYCALAALGVCLLMRGTWLRRRGGWLACRTAASAAQPYLVTLDEAKWNGRDAYAKWSGETAGFGRQIQASDGAERIFFVACPLLFVACAALSVVASVGAGAPERLPWCLSATLSACTALSGALCFSSPWYRLCRRLAQSGAAIAGWDGVTAAGASGVLLTDADLFPPGTVTLNGIKVFGDFPVDKVISCTATLIRDSGSALERVFHDLLRAQGCVYRRCSDFHRYEGGLGAEIRGEQILVGSAALMHLMEISLPQGLKVKNAVFCAIDGELAGIFALNYTLHPLVEPSLNALIRNGVTPILATRDFNLIPDMLRQRFKLPVDKMGYPPTERRTELSDEEQPHGDILTAVLCREGVGPYAEAVVGAVRLRRAVRLSALLTTIGAAIGVLLAFYLCFMGAYVSLSPANLLFFLLMWLVPTLLISGWVNKY